ncbi:MAG: 3-keto-disaccharide hydrolase [Prolixibacteraceae bacterium]
MQKQFNFSKVILFGIIVLLSACNSSNQKEADENWIQLFNGKDLNDWQIKFTNHEPGENYNNTFQVEDGMLRVRYDNWEKWNDRYGHIFYKDEFSHYRLRVEYRFVDDQVTGGPGWAFRNNGLMLHCQSPETLEPDQNFPVSVPERDKDQP